MTALTQSSSAYLSEVVAYTFAPPDNQASVVPCERTEIEIWHESDVEFLGSFISITRSSNAPAASNDAFGSATIA